MTAGVPVETPKVKYGNLSQNPRLGQRRTASIPGNSGNKVIDAVMKFPL